VRHIVELHGGSVFADSAGEGQGATFTVHLPLMVQAPQLSQKPLTTSIPSLVNFSILIVDDDEDTLEFLALLLEQAGAAVTAVSSAQAALAALGQQSFNLMLSDIGMPGMDGYMLLQQIRAFPPHRGGQMPAIALTAYAGELDQQRAASVGFQQHIAKPLDPNALLRSISSLLKRSSSIL
ncbi:MAG TPA: response regulator, partial [Coleofasciculaceae cyanobacterium]